MKLFGPPQVFRPEYFTIAPFHRAGLGLETDTSVFLAPVPSEIRPEYQPKQVFPGLIISTLNPDKWGNLWRLSLTLRERSGVVSQLLQLLRTEANIAILETLTTETSKYHEVYAVIDLEKFLLKYRRRKTRSIKKSITKTILEAADRLSCRDMIIEDSILLAPLERLRRAQLARQKAGITDTQETVVKRGQLDISSERLITLLRDAQDNLTEGDVPGRIMMFSDTEEKYLSCFFPGRDQTLLRLAILHRDVPGAIADFCRAIAAKEANILNSYSRLQRMGDKAEWRVIADVSRLSSVRSLLESIRDISIKYDQEGQSDQESAPPNHDNNPPDRDIESAKQSKKSGKKKDSPFLEIRAVQIFPGRDHPQRHLELGTNPYNESESVSRSSTFVGRERLLKTIQSGVRNENFLLEGFSRTGKTSVLEVVSSDLTNQPDLVIVYTSSLGTGEDFWRHIVFAILKELEIYYPSEAKDIASSIDEARVKRERSGDVEVARAVAWKGNRALIDAFLQVDRLLEATASIDARGSTILPSRLVVVLDESQMALAQDGDISLVSELWLYVLNTCRYIRWIVAAGIRTGPVLPPELLAKFTKEMMGPLDVASAKELIIKNFEKRGVAVHYKAVRSLLEITGCNPAYLQVICRELWMATRNRASNLDVIVTSDVALGTKAAVRKLSSHFIDQYSVLSELLPEEILVERLLRGGESVPLSEALDIGRERRVMLDVFPGLRIGEVAGIASVCATEIFRNWAASSGLIRRKRRVSIRINRRLQRKLVAKIEEEVMP